MNISSFVRKYFGCSYPVDLNEEALRLYSQVQRLDPSFVDEAKKMDYDYAKCSLLQQKVKTTEEWVKLAWCYNAVAYRHVIEENVSITEISMGMINSPYRTILFNSNDTGVQPFSVAVNRLSYRANKGFVSYVESISAPCDSDCRAWQDSVNETLSLLTQITPEGEIPNLPRFDLKEMRETEGGYLSYFYKVSFGRYVLAFRTTEHGFDIFALIRSILRDMPICVSRFLGEYSAELR